MKKSITFLFILVCLCLSVSAEYDYAVNESLDWQSDGSTDPFEGHPDAAPGVDYDQEDLEQWRDACGDDPNEYLVKQHDPLDSDAESNIESDHWACATLPDNCYYDGFLFEEGQPWNLGDDTVGGDSGDYQACLNYDSTPLGEFYDLDDDHMRESQLNSRQFESLEASKIDSLWGQNPGTVDNSEVSFNLAHFNYDGSGDVSWDTGSDGLGRYSSGFYQPEGYATQQNCNIGSSNCDDSGNNPTGYFNAGEFVEGAEQDNTDLGGVHNRQEENSNQFQPSSPVSSNWVSSEAGDRFSEFGEDFEASDYDSTTPGPETWALSSSTSMAIDNDGEDYSPGRCHGGSRSDRSDDSETKFDRAFGNSYADSSGTWRNPDDLSSSQLAGGAFSCDLTGPDKGIGYDDGSTSDSWSFEGDNYVVGGIEFQYDQSSYDGELVQEGPVCGDDNFEYLVEEQGEAENSAEDTGPWGCAVSNEYCVVDDSGDVSFHEVGSYVNTGETGESHGRLKNDREFCDKRDDDLHATWYDQDYHQDYCRENSLYSDIGKRWFSEDYVSAHPHAVTGGINDDYNPYMGEKSSVEVIESTQGDVSEYEDNPDGSTPVPTGTSDLYDNKSVTKGFCVGDDASEYFITQESNTRFVETDRTVWGAAADSNNCVLANDRSETNTAEDERMLYDQGETETIVEDGNSHEIACFSGQWWGDWPVVFLEDVSLTGIGETGHSTFTVINPESSSRTIELDLSFGDANNDVEQSVSFAETNTDEMTVDIPAESSRSYEIQIDAQSGVEVEESDENTVELQGRSQREDLEGYDQIDILITDTERLGSDSMREVPGIQGVQLAVLTLLASLIFFFFKE